MHLLYQTATFSLSHDPVHNWLYSQWTGISPAELAQAECEIILAYVQRLKSTKLLNNGLADENGWASISGWVAESFIQRLAQEGIVAIAWVQPIHSHALHSMQRVLHRLQAFETRQPLLDVFMDVESAYAWLAQWPENGK